MTSAAVTSHGRITIPAEVRLALQVVAGDQVDFVQLEPGQFLFLAAKRSVTALKGMFGETRIPASIDDMNSAIAAHKSEAR